MRHLLLAILIIFIGMEFVFAKECAEKFRLTNVLDGDTVQGVLNGEQVSIRLSGIDCYETTPINRAYKQAYLNKISIEEVVKQGKRSKRILTSFLKNHQDFSVKISTKDHYGREVGVLYADDINVNKYMLENGGCLNYVYKASSKYR